MSASLLRVVFDTNVYVSAALHGRRAEKVMNLASAQQLVLVVSETILTELEGKLIGKFQWSQKQAAFFERTIRELAEVVEPQITLNVVPDDDDDNRIVECAVAGKANLIVTFDKDLLRLKSYETIGIITPQQMTFYGLGNK